MKTYWELQQLSNDWLISITTSVENIITRTYVEFENSVSSLLREFNYPKRLLNVIDSPPLLELLWKWALGTRFALPRLPHTWNITFVDEVTYSGKEPSLRIAALSRNHILATVFLVLQEDSEEQMPLSYRNFRVISGRCQPSSRGYCRIWFALSTHVYCWFLVTINKNRNMEGRFSMPWALVNSYSL